MGFSRDSDLTLEELCEVIAPIAVKHGIIKVYLFGSKAWGDNSKESDYDFCIVVPSEYDLFDLGAILYDLQEALDAKVDIVCEDNLKEESYIAKEVLVTIGLYSKRDSGETTEGLIS